MLTNVETNVGSPRDRVDGPAKVTGAALYAAEFQAPGLLHGAVVSSAIAKGKITKMDTAAALGVPGVVQVFTHENRMRTAFLNSKYQDEVGPPGEHFRPLYDGTIIYSGQPIALVVAETLETALYAASLVRVEYEAEAPTAPTTDLAKLREKSYVPPKKRSGINPPPKPRGDAAGAFESAPVRVSNEFTVPFEHHNPMEPHATTVVWEGDGKLLIHDKIQGSNNSQSYVCGVFGLSKDDVRVVSPFIGGAFGSGLRPQYQLFLTVMAALELQRSVRVALTRDQMFTIVYRPYTTQTVSLGAAQDGTLQALKHDAVAVTSTFEDHQEVVVNWSGTLYRCANVALTYELSKINTYTPGDMRAPGAPIGVFAIESAMDELASRTGVNPVELRLKNYTDQDEDEGKQFTSKELAACYQLAAERFGWSKRNPEPRSMREGRELIGWGMASGIWESQMVKSSARVALDSGRQGGGRNLDRGHRHRHLHDPDPDRGRRAGSAYEGRDDAAQRLHAAGSTRRGRLADRGLVRHRRAHCLRHGPRDAAQIRPEDRQLAACRGEARHGELRRRPDRADRRPISLRDVRGCHEGRRRG